MKHIPPLLFLCIAFFMEATFISLPTTMLVLFLWYVIAQDQRIFLWAFVFGFFLDVLLVGSLGLRSMFFVAFIFLLFLYERKFEIKTLPFVFFASFFGALFYNFLVVKESNFLLYALETSALAVLCFFVSLQLYTRKIEGEIG